MYRKEYSSIVEERENTTVAIFSEISQKMQELPEVKLTYDKRAITREIEEHCIMSSFDKIELEDIDTSIPITVYLEDERCKDRRVANLVQKVLIDKIWLPYYAKPTFREFLS